MNIIRRSFHVVGILVFLTMFSRIVPAENVTINGAGASFPFPVYSQWAHQYASESEMRLNYQSIGSGGGIAHIKANAVDFGASDAPLNAAELERFDLLQFPIIMGGVVPVVNLQGIQEGRLKLSADLLADIFLGKITRWNDPAIQALNRGLLLPSTEITVVHRADGSGTTWIFTNYLNQISQEWSRHVGTAKAIEWPIGMGGKGNEGVSQHVKKVDGAIGYVEFAYALQNKMTSVLLRNRAGKFVAPTIGSFQAAAKNADWGHAPGFYMVLTHQPGEESWPITGASFILLHKRQRDAQVAEAMLAFFEWCYLHGGETAESLHYVPIPHNVVEQVKALWKTTITANGLPVWK